MKKTGKSAEAYRLRMLGMSWSEIAEIVGSQTKTVPTLAKGYRDSHNLPDWDHTVNVKRPALIVSDSQTQTGAGVRADIDESRPVDALVAARMLVESLKDTTDPVLLTLIGDIARISSGILRSKK